MIGKVVDQLSNLPEIVLETGTDGCTYAVIGEWSFCIQEEIEFGDAWGNARAYTALALYLDNLKEEQA
jgi:radical SAM superfamily enzyme with C-terminal helix-hairpin-helix motif